MNKALILVVEDDRPIRNLIVTTLKTHDYKYITAENGSSAILEASSHGLTYQLSLSVQEVKM